MKVTTGLKVCICRDSNGGQGVACSCGGLLTRWGNRWGCSKLLFLHTTVAAQYNPQGKLLICTTILWKRKHQSRLFTICPQTSPHSRLDTFSSLLHLYEIILKLWVVESGTAIYLYFRATTSNTGLIIISHDSNDFLSYCSSIPWCFKIFNNFNRIKRLQWKTIRIIKLWQ